MTVQVNLENEVMKLYAAIRKHRDQRGDDRCWMDDAELYSVLPEGYMPPKTEVAVELENCRRFIECRRNPKTEYVSPQREIERLKDTADSYEKQLLWLAGWCKEKLGVENNTVIGRGGWPYTLVEVVAKAIELKLLRESSK